ncbi:PAS domain-containing protein [Comamonadaceae bacterium OH3737_COT-264]|nr:PAS domain-containing protein [Comamonadaceae bacterium OH3737_COT-264]
MPPPRPPALLPSPTERFHAFDALATLLAVVDGDGRVLFVNAALEDALHLSRQHLAGLPVFHFAGDAAALRGALQAVARQELASLRYDDELRGPGGEALPVHVTVSAGEREGEFLLECLPRAQQARQDHEERLIDQSQASKELLRNLAHEVKNPLGGIRGAAQLLEMDLGHDPGLREYTQVIIGECDRLQALVDRLLEPHRHRQRLGPVNIHEVCERVRALVLAEFAQGLRLERDYDTSIPPLHGDREQLIQAVLNIARNAAQALAARRAAGDALIRFKTRVARQVTIGKARHRLALQLHVMDNGPGVPEAIRSRVFLPLVSGRDGGTGLGLALAQTFVQQHGGLIELHSQPGQTDFCILLPLP